MYEANSQKCCKHSRSINDIIAKVRLPHEAQLSSQAAQLEAKSLINLELGQKS